MKKQYTLSLLIVLSMLMSHQLAAQSARAGIKGGLNFSNLYLEDVGNENARVGYNLGIYSQVMLGDALALQPELIFNTKGARAEYDVLGFTGENRFNLSYLELPMLLVFKVGEAIDIHAGPYFGLLLRANVESEGDFGEGREQLDSDNFKNMDYGLSAGFAINFGPLTGGVRYNYGLQKLANNEAAEFFLGDSKNSMAQIYVAIDLLGN